MNFSRIFYYFKIDNKTAYIKNTINLGQEEAKISEY